MDALSFRNALQEAKPAADALAGIGLDDNEAAQIAASFDVRKRSVEQGNDLPDAVLHDLLARYDASRVEVGMVHFFGAPSEPHTASS